MVLGNAGLSDDVPFVDEESRSSGGCLVPVLRDCPAVQAHLRGAYTYLRQQFDLWEELYLMRWICFVLGGKSFLETQPQHLGLSGKTS